MKRMGDKEFFGATEGEPLFNAAREDSWDGRPPSTLRVTDPLDKVADPELRKIMETVLEEDAELIAYLRNR
jgi:hypothetical protein